MYGEEAESFAKFPAFEEWYKAADPHNFSKIAIHKDTGHFQAAFFAPAGLQYAARFMRQIIGVDGTHTGSKFRMTLLVAVGIDANDETLSLAWALVPIESETWWTWFLKQFEKAFQIDIEGNVIISDREKGLSPAL
jgi:hypothetical protein